MKAKIASLLSVLLVVTLLAAACGPTPQPQIVKETVIVPGTPEVVEKQVTVEVPVETVVTATPQPATGKIKRGGVLKVGFEADFLNLDPAYQEAWVDMVPKDMSYDTLLKWDPVTLEPKPMLAKSWEVSDDGLTWTFKLQEGVKFHNGDDLTADDVKFSVDRIIDPNGGSTMMSELSAIDTVEVVDKLTFRFHLKYPYSPLLNTLCNLPAVQSKKFVEAAGGQTPRTIMGTGPWIMAEWLPDQVMRFTKNPNYWRLGEDLQPLPYLDEIDFFPQPDETARVADFMAGVSDFMDLVPDKDVATLLKDSNVVMYGPQTLWYSYIGFLNDKPPFNDKRVRQAVSWAMNRDEIVKTGLFGRGTPMYGGAVPDWHWAGNQLDVYNRQDLDKAKALLAEAGYPEGKGFPELTIYVGAPYQSEITLAEMTASYLKEIGINAKVEVQEWGTFIDGMRGGKFLIWSCGESPLGDPDNTYYQLFHSQGSTNHSHYSNAEVDKLLTDARIETDPAKRKDLYRQAEQILLDDTPFAFAFFHEVWLASHLPVKNFVKPANDMYFTLTNIWLDK